MTYIQTLNIVDISDALLNQLREVYPNTIPMKANITEVELARLQGQQDVVNYLQTKQTATYEENLAAIKEPEKKVKYRQ